LLGLRVEVYLSLGETEKAVPAAEALVKLASEGGQPGPRGRGALHRRAAHRAAGTAGLDELGRALEEFSRLELPHEAARVRLELASAIAEERPEVALGKQGSPWPRSIIWVQRAMPTAPPSSCGGWAAVLAPALDARVP